jgi:hypothetical protein
MAASAREAVITAGMTENRVNSGRASRRRRNSAMTDSRYFTDPPRPPNETPGSWYRKCREREKGEFAEAKRAGAEAAKAEIRTILARAERLGRGAYAVAVSLLDSGLSPDEIIRCAEKVPSEVSESVHRARPGAITATPAPRAATPEAESAWLREARLAAETQWARAFGLPVPQPDRRSAEQIALHESFGELAARAAGLVRDPDDGRKIYRHDRIDEVDVDLYQRGAAAARKLWPGI